MPDDLEIPFDRVTYREGQLLTSRDRLDDKRRAQRLRWLHTRYLHETWGIVLGFEVQPGTGGTSVLVGPGFAVDDHGREIVLSEGMQIAVPLTNSPTRLVLTMTYQDDSNFRDPARSSLSCTGGSLDPRNERPTFAWQRPLDVRLGRQIPVVDVVAAGGVIQGALDLRVRRNARRLARPRIGLGFAEVGFAEWISRKLMELPFAILETIVDTSEAGFDKTPHYFAFLEGPFPEEVPFGGSASTTTGLPDWVTPKLDASTYITAASPNQFKFRMIIGEGMPLSVGDVLGKEPKSPWRIAWMGLEPFTGCPPEFRLSRFFSLAGVPQGFLGGGKP